MGHALVVIVSGERVFRDGVEARAGFGHTWDVAMAAYREIAIAGAECADQGEDGAFLGRGAGVAWCAAIGGESADVADGD